MQKAIQAGASFYRKYLNLKIMPKLKELIDEQFDFWLNEKEIDDREPDREEPDDHIAEHDEREWQAAIDKRIE